MLKVTLAPKITLLTFASEEHEYAFDIASFEEDVYLNYNGYDGLSYDYSKEFATLIFKPERDEHYPAAKIETANKLIECANNGSKLILETQESLIIDSVRLAVANGTIAPEDVASRFITGAIDDMEVIDIAFDTRGGLSKWPKGFLDHNLNILTSILRARKIPVND